MPVLHVQIIEKPGAAPEPDLSGRLADAVGQALGARPGTTWVLVTRHSLADYGENGGTGEEPPAPVFVRILAWEPPSGASLREEITALTQVVARTCGREPSEVHLLYEPAARGRVAFGGALVE